MVVLISGKPFMNTVSSPPVARLREQDRSDPSLMGIGPMESQESNFTSWPNHETEEKTKKDKKWSIGKFFRRKKKESESESSSTDDHSHKQNSKKKHMNKKHKPVLMKNSFEYVNSESTPNQRSQSVTKFAKHEYYDEGVLSDPSAGFIGYVGRGLPRSPFDRTLLNSKDSVDKRGPESSCGSQDGSLRKGRKGRIKARVEAIRNMKNESSSDEESQRSTSSSIFRFRSDDSLANHSKNDSVSKKTRSSRTDRYIKRLSRDEEITNDKEFEVIQRIVNKTDSELFSSRQRVPSTPLVNGVSHDVRDEPEYCEPHLPCQVNQNMPEKSYSGTHLYQNRTNSRPSTITGSNSSVYSYPIGVINFNAKVNDENISYSIPYSNVNKQNKQAAARYNGVENNNNVQHVHNNDKDNVMVVKFPLGNVNVSKKENAPPVPPPRDPQRKVVTPLSHMYDNIRPVIDNAESNVQRNIPYKMGENRPNLHSSNSYLSQNVYENNIPSKNVNNLSWMKRPISTSEDHIAMQQNYYNPNIMYKQHDQPKRPSSVATEVIRPEYYNRICPKTPSNPSYVTNHQNNPENQNYLYFADKTPRSRKPIHITPTSVNTEQQNMVNNMRTEPKNASEFWKKMDDKENNRRRQLGHTRASSDQTINIVTNKMHMRKPPMTNNALNDSYKPQYYNGDIRIIQSNDHVKPTSILKNVSSPNNQLRNIKNDEPICYSNIDIIPMDDIRKENKNAVGRNSDDDQTRGRRKSTNLDDALSELEAIYNSLGLGDEDLLDRAEKRELMTPKSTESFPFNNSSMENYFRYPNYSGINDIHAKRNQINRRSSIPDKLHDDMAFRRMNPHERPKSKDVNSLVSQVSYMLASPVLTEPFTNVPNNIDKVNNQEPDIILDDVVFRNIRQANNYLKIDDPQPPFGIPIGPVSPAPHSNYLHVAPETKDKYRNINENEPDVVADDLAYRTLRKDSKYATFNSDDAEDLKNDDLKNIRSSAIFDNHVIRKKRAVRSLSANIFTLIQKEIDDAIGLYNNRPIEKAQSIPDLPETVVEFGKSGKLPSDSSHLKDVDIKNVQENKITDSYTTNQSRKNFYNEIINNSSSNGNDERLTVKPPVISTTQEKSRGSTPIPKGSCSPKNTENAKKYFDSNHKLEDRYVKPTVDYQYNGKKPIKVTIENNFKSNFPRADKKQFTVENSTVVYTSNPQNIVINQNTNIVKDPLEIQTKSCITNKNKSNENIQQPDSKGKFTEDSLIEISNQLKKIGPTLKSNQDIHDNLDEKNKLESLAKKCDLNLNENLSNQNLKDTCIMFNHKSHEKPLTKNDIMPIMQENNGNFGCQSSTSSICKTRSSTKEALEKISSFEDLRRGINDLLDGITQVTDKFNMQKSSNIAESRNINMNNASPSFEDDSDKAKDNRASPEYNSSEELAMIFNLNKADNSATMSPTIETVQNIENNDSHLELNSPRLVKTAHQSLSKHSGILLRDVEEGESSKQLSSETTTRDVPWRKHRRQPSTDNASKGACDSLTTSKTNTWYQDTDFLMLACLYTMAYTQQLAGLETLTLLGLALAMISIITMLIL